MSRRSEALDLSTRLLEEIEMSSIDVENALRKAGRLASLLDDELSRDWILRELFGWSADDRDDPGPGAAARAMHHARSRATKAGGFAGAAIAMLRVTNAALRDAADGDPGPDVLFSMLATERIFIEALNRTHAFAARVNLELRFGQVAEDAFDTVRNEVDAKVSRLVPNATVKLAGAFENASSSNSEHWANAASGCRRLLKDLADVLRPPGDPVNKRAMTDGAYINRLVDWISNQLAVGGTLRSVVASDLEDFGKRLDAFDAAGHKGAHDTVTKYEASRYVAGAYLLVGDILQIKRASEEAGAAPAVEAG